MSKPVSISLNCPCCDNTFESYELNTESSVLRQTTDFYILSEGTQPIYYSLHTCTSCGYTGEKTDFDGHSIDEKLKQLVCSQISPMSNGKTAFGGNQFEYAAMIAKWKEEPDVKIGELYLKAAWCYKSAKSKVGEKNCRLKAIGHFEKGILKNEVNQTRLAFYSFLVGELYRRIDNMVSAQKWYKKSIALAQENLDYKWLFDLAEAQCSDPKDELDPRLGIISYAVSFA
jgi:uncharacterized protein (DUF2225 family)